MTSLAHRGFIHLGMDVSRDSISVAVPAPDSDVAEIDKISSDEESVRRLVKRLGRPAGLWACYEAGPTGYDLYRLLGSMGVRCDVVAPSLVPKGRGDMIKTDRRDARRLAGLHRAGELTPIGVPSPQQEAVRDLCRTRGDMVADLTRARNRLGKFLLRHSLIYRGGSTWTDRHQRWLANVHFEDKALASTFIHYRATVNLRDTTLEAVEEDLKAYFRTEPFAQAVLRLGAYRGVTHMGACAWEPRSSTGPASPRPGRSWTSPGLPARSTPAGCPPTGAGSPVPATPTSGASSPRRPGPTTTWPASPTAYASAKTAARCHARPLLDRPDPALQALPRPRRPQEHQVRRRHRRGPGAGRVLVGRDDRGRLIHETSLDHGLVGAAVTEHSRRAGAPPQQTRPSPALYPTIVHSSRHGRPYSEAPICVWIYCDLDSRTASWRFSDPQRSGASTDRRPALHDHPHGSE